jgi:mono/diheme cytochrome c family protein
MKLLVAKRLIMIMALVIGGYGHAEVAVELTPERVARGEYLTLQVIGCQGCHSERNLDRYGFPPKEDMVLAGGVIFRDAGDRAITPNITPYALGSWSDQEVFDAITAGVRPDGRKLHPSMPYERYGAMEPERIYEVIAYLRSIEPITAGPYPAVFSEPPARKLVVGPIVDPGADATPEERGAYLVGAAGCNGCHVGTGGGVDGQPLAGGREFEFPGRGMIRAANITPDRMTGMGAWTEEAFVARFLAMRGAEAQPVEPGAPNTVMHWWQYSYLEEADLRAMYAHLMNVPAVANRVVRFEQLAGEVLESINWSERVAD